MPGQGEPQYEDMPTSEAYDNVLAQAEGDAEIAQSVIESMIADKRAELSRAEKAKPKGGKTVAEKIAAEKARKAAIEDARASLEAWENIAEEGKARAQAAEQARLEAEEKAAAEQAAADSAARDAQENTETEPQGGTENNAEPKTETSTEGNTTEPQGGTEENNKPKTEPQTETTEEIPTEPQGGTEEQEQGTPQEGTETDSIPQGQTEPQTGTPQTETTEDAEQNAEQPKTETAEGKGTTNSAPAQETGAENSQNGEEVEDVPDVVDDKPQDVEAVNERFNEELAKFETGELPKGHRFNLGYPSTELRSAGFDNLPITMRSSLLGKKAGNEKHPFKASDLRGLVNAIQKPIAIFEYSKGNMRNLIVDVERNGKKFLVGVTLNYKANDIEVNSVSGLFPKDNHEWVKWIQDGKAIRIDQKEKVQDIIDSLRTNPAESERIGLNLDSAAKVVETFENPTDSGKKLLDESENIQESGQNEGLGTEDSAETEDGGKKTDTGATEEAQKPAPAQPDGKAGKGKAAAEKGRKIEDFGEKLGGARKDKAMARMDELRDMGGEEVAEQKKMDDILPRKDIVRLMNEGKMPRKVGNLLLGVNIAGEVVNKMFGKPRVRCGSQIAAEVKKLYADYLRAFAEGTLTEEEAGRMADEAQKRMWDWALGLPNGAQYNAKLAATHFGTWLRPVMDTYAALGEETDGVLPLVVRRSNLSGEYYVIAPGGRQVVKSSGTFEGALAALREELAERAGKKRGGQKGDTAGKAGRLRVVEAGRNTYRVKSTRVHGTVYFSPPLGSREAAERYLAEHGEELARAEERFASALERKSVLSVEREGVDYRGGRDVTEKEFMDSFGFRGVEFGNWVTNAERQPYLNTTYDALMDLCAILGLPSRAVSLDGRLGLSFGGRGQGGAMAHYETGRAVINLTRTKGAGAIAHEWFHALDNYLEHSAGGKGSSFATESGERSTVRAELAAAFRGLVDTMEASDYHARSRRLDHHARGKKKPYWATSAEEAARAFEAYVYDKLDARSARSPMLVDRMGAPYGIEGTHTEAEQESLSYWPYPMGEERAEIGRAFDALFGEMRQETRPDGNVVLYQRMDGEQASELGSDEVALRDALAERLRGAGIEVITDDVAGQDVLDAAERGEQGGDARLFRTESGEAYGFTADGRIYLDPRVATAETPVHEYTHLWSDALREGNPAAWGNVVELMRGTWAWEHVQRLYPELTSDDAIADEALAHYSGRRGAERARAAMAEAEKQGGLLGRAAAISGLERLQKALGRFWQDVCGMLGVRFTTADEVADRVMADLMNGVKPKGRSTAEVREERDETAESGLQDEESGLLFRDEETGTDTGGAAARASETVAGRRAAMADAARDAAARLGLDNVDIVEDASGLDGRLRDKKGWYDPRTGRITVVADNHTGAADVTRTLLHEGVAHHGLRGLFGEGFGEFVDGVYENATEDVRAAIDGMAARGGLTRAVATEEYLAGLAERGAFEGAGRGLWERVKNLFRTMLRKAGLKADALTDADLRYTLWQSYENLRRGGREAGVLDKAADMAKREELGIGNERETPDHWGKGGVLDKAAMAANGVDAGLLFRDSIEDTDDTARVIYNIRAGSALAAFIEAHVDGMRSVRMLQEAVMKQLGGTLEDWEDAYNEENRRHGHAQDEMEYFEKSMYEPLIKAVNEVAKLAKVSVGEVVEYMMAKSGIERNDVLARRDGRDVGQGARGHGVEGRNKVCDRGWLALV